MKIVFVYRPGPDRQDESAQVLDQDGNVLGAWVSSNRTFAFCDTSRYVPHDADVVVMVYSPEALNELIAKGLLKGEPL